MSNILPFKEEEETMSDNVINLIRPAGSGPKDGGNYLKDMKKGCCFHAQFRHNDKNITNAFMFEVVKLYEDKTALLAQFDPATQQHHVQIFGQDRFCHRFELIYVDVEGSDEKEEKNNEPESLDGAG